jgi:hypothetical protein
MLMIWGRQINGIVIDKVFKHSMWLLFRSSANNPMQNELENVSASGFRNTIVSSKF